MKNVEVKERPNRRIQKHTEGIKNINLPNYITNPKKPENILCKPTRFTRISSLQIINPKCLIPSPIHGECQAADATRDKSTSLKNRRCNSMPKVTFTYKNPEKHM